VAYVDAPAGQLAGLDPFEAELLVVLGGPIGVYQEHLYPFLTDEIRVVERRLGRALPTLGICLGAQVMARALGAKVYPGRKEMGWSPLLLTLSARATGMRHLQGTEVLHWHGDTFDMPDGAVHLASTPLCRNQAYSWGDHGLAFQFHAEVRPERLEAWYVGHACELAMTATVDIPGLRAQSRRSAAALADPAKQMFGEWLDQFEWTSPPGTKKRAL
jgi:GMP synthase (glutamine-hydrolysing)